MRTIERSSEFRRDYKREARGQYRTAIDELLVPVLDALANDRSLETRLRDHALSGNWSSYRECDMKPDLLLIYQKPNEEILWLARLGSHSELFG